ncbi:MAG: polysaccharide deacetylase family protein [Wenzhouxiangella sp.]|nr:polysaccharide deacetylase family protein [Wenzhouxiangella sp.]
MFDASLSQPVFLFDLSVSVFRWNTMRGILTYHSLHARDWSYASNDHLALAQDLEILRRLDYCVLTLHQLIEAVAQSTVDHLPSRCVALICDDGVDQDVFDFYHPEWGLLLSFKTTIERQIASGYQASMTSFVIACPEARRQLDEECIAGRGQWTDDWWGDVAALDYWDIGCHSWDHNHPALISRVTPRLAPGSFRGLSTHQEAESQVANAYQYLQGKTNGLCRPWFAYPYGHYPDYLVSDYLPNESPILAALTTQGGEIKSDTEPYAIPRFVCGEHWTSPAELISILS